MKPRIYKLLGLWRCSREGDKTGLGFTPLEAYQEWLAMRALKWFGV